MVQKYSFIVFFVLFVAGCKNDTKQYSNVPQIALSSIQQVKLNGKDSIVDIVLSYSDGDGDLGLNIEDTLSPYNYPGKYFYNLWVYVYRIDNGVASKVTIPVTPPAIPDTINYNERILNLTPTGKSKSISGEIKLFIKANPYPGVNPDSMFYTFQLVDRALQTSNIVTSPVMKFEF